MICSKLMPSINTSNQLVILALHCNIEPKRICYVFWLIDKKYNTLGFTYFSIMLYQ